MANQVQYPSLSHLETTARNRKGSGGAAEDMTFCVEYLQYPGVRPPVTRCAEKPGTWRGVRNRAPPSRAGRYSRSVGARRGATGLGSAAKGGPLVTSMCTCVGPHSPAPAAPLPQMHSRLDRGRDPARYNCRHAHRHSAGPADLRNQQSAVAEGTARVGPNPNDAQVTPSPVSPEISAETVARGIALGVSAGLPDHEEMGSEENGDAPGSAERPPCAVGLRDAQEMGGEERAAEEADAEASAHAPAAADRQGGLTQHVQGPTNTPARWGARQADEEELASAQSGGQARLRRDAQGHAVETRQAQGPAARSPQNPRAPDPVARMGPSPPTAPHPTPARRPIGDEADRAPLAGRAGAAGGRGTRGIRVGCGSIRRGRRGNGRGRRGEGARGTNRRRTGASGYARTAERLMREGAEGGEEVLSEEAEDEVEIEASDGGDPAFNPEREGMFEAEAEEDEAELELLLQEMESPDQQARGDPANRTTHRNRTAGENRARGGSQAATEDGIDSAAANENSEAPNPTPLMLKPDDLAKNTDLFAQVADWDLDPLRDSRQPPLARHPPEDLRESFAICMLTPLLHLAANPESPPGWKLLTFLPHLLLRTSSALLEALTARHPPARQSLPDWLHTATAEDPPTVEACDFRRLLAKLPNGVGAGPSGTTFEHIRDAALGNAEVLTHLLALTNTTLARKLPATAGELLTASRLLAFTKPQGGTRPIAVGECLLRIITKAALFLTAPAARTHFTPLQFGVAVAGGIEAAIHTACTYLEVHPGAVALQIDLANAFNAVERRAVFEGLRNEALKALIPLVRLSYGAASSLFLDHDFGAAPLQSARGVRQGDPLGPLLFAASIHPCLVDTAAAHPQVVLLAYADDITLLGDATACTAAFVHLTSALAALGLVHNPGKCAAWSAVAPRCRRAPPPTGPDPRLSARTACTPRCG
ncbi:unnamed protein product [Closterium sp. NIES-53]